MAVTRERFEQGMTYDEYKAQMTRNRERLETVEHDLALTAADLAPFKNLKQPLNVLVLGEDWCGDVIANLPILARLAQESGKLNPRVFLRDQNLDLMDQYLKDGEFRSIPVFAFLDDDFNEVGRFIERPASVTELRAQKRRELFAQNPRFGSPDAPIDQLPEDVRTDLMQATNAMREETAPFANSEVVRELGAIAARA
ncbi:MAG TPA: thioredoxin family protein [Thermomicrobiales bacterium]|nr:thioredoxin family protein [Thermomicrobiales bacterium]